MVVEGISWRRMWDVGGLGDGRGGSLVIVGIFLQSYLPLLLILLFSLSFFFLFLLVCLGFLVMLSSLIPQVGPSRSEDEIR